MCSTRLSFRFSIWQTAEVFKGRSTRWIRSFRRQCSSTRARAERLVVPGHGYLCDEHEVTEYRDMLAIVRDRVKALIASGASLDQVKTARVTADYETRYGANSGPWTTGDVRRGGV